jgi:hypothetical protein
MLGHVARFIELIAIAVLCAGEAASAAERVQFESARYQAGPLQQRLARERGETVAPAAVDRIDGYLTTPPVRPTAP